MMRIWGVVFFFLFLPVLCVALALQSKWVMGVGALLATVGVILFSFRARQFFLKSKGIRVIARDASQGAFYHTVHQIVHDHAPEGVRYSYFESPEVESVLRVWVRGLRDVELIFSRGLIQTIRESELRELILNKTRYDQIRVQGWLEALDYCSNKMRGKATGFRYWWISFWFFPFEQVLGKQMEIKS